MQKDKVQYNCSLFLKKDGKTLYAMHENSPIKLAWQCTGYFKEGVHQDPAWKILLNFNTKNKSIELGKQHFKDHGQSVSNLLMNEMMAIDSEIMLSRGGEPVFEDVLTKKRLKVNEVNEIDIQDLKDHSRHLTEVSFLNIMDNIFSI
jgi:hypothetical protein